MDVAARFSMRGAVFLVALMLSAGVPACEQRGAVSPDNVPLAIMVVGTKAEDPIWRAVRAGTARHARETRKLVVQEMMPSAATPVAQIAAIDKMLAGPVRGIVCIMPVDGKVLKHSISKLVARSVRVILIGKDAPETSRRLFVGADDKAIGEELGKIVAALGKDHLNLMVVHDDKKDPRSRARHRTFSLVVRRHRGLKILREYDCDGDPGKALEFAYKTSERFPNLGAWVLLGDFLDEDLPAGRKLIHGSARVIGYGASPRALDLLDDGRVHALVDVDWEETGYRAIVQCQQLASVSVPRNADYFSPPVVITKKDVEAHRKKWREWLAPGAATGRKR